MNPSPIPPSPPSTPSAAASRPAREGNVTVGAWPEHLKMDPIVGWLVAFEGKSAGRDYRLRAGRMRVGRDPDMDVQIDDDSISRKNHAFIVYDDIAHEFHLQPGEQRGLVRLAKNRQQPKLVLQAEILDAYDTIYLGKTKLFFVPFCGPDTFQWRQTEGGATGASASNSAGNDDSWNGE